MAREDRSRNPTADRESTLVVSSKENAVVWHRRLGHLNMSDLVEAERKGTIKGLNLKDFRGKIDCDTCFQGKITEFNFSQRSNRKSTILELLHTDVCCPMRTQSIGKAKYFIEYIDDHTRWSEVRFIQEKSDVLQTTK